MQEVRQIFPFPKEGFLYIILDTGGDLLPGFDIMHKK